MRTGSWLLDGLARVGAAAVLISGAALSSPASAASTYALVIGINEYDVEEDLAGAVADANDVAGALREFGVERLEVLRDGAATRDAIEQTFNRYLSLALPGDTILIHYAGHGGQITDLNGDEDDPIGRQFDESLMLSRFNRRDPSTYREQIVDDEINRWFTRAHRAGVEILFVVDACFSGTMTRSGMTGMRVVPPFQISDERTRSAAGEPSTLDPMTPEAESQLDNVVFLAAASETRPSHEFPIGGEIRGALSYAFARALEGRGDLNGDGHLSKDELARFTKQLIRQHTTRHTPDLQPRGGRDRIVLYRQKELPTSSVGGGSGAFAGGGSLDDFALGLGSTRSTMALGAAGALIGVDMVDDEEADLVWDPETGETRNGENDVVAEDIAEYQLQGVVDKFRFVRMVQQMALGGMVETTLLPSDARHSEGALLSFTISERTHPYVTVFNIANDGKVQPLFPARDSERAAQAENQPVSFNTRVTPPFGADHVIVFASERPLTALWDEWDRLTPGDLLTRVPSLLRDQRVEVAVHPIYSAPRE